MKSQDIVAEFAALARGAGVEPEAANRMADQIRSQFGGQKVRILPREPVTIEQIESLQRQGKRVTEVAGSLNVSRATIYRHLGKKITRRRRNETA